MLVKYLDIFDFFIIYESNFELFSKIKKATSCEEAFNIYWRTGRDTNSLTILSYSFFNSQSTSHIYRKIKNYLSYTVLYSITEYFRYLVPKIAPKIDVLSY